MLLCLHCTHAWAEIVFPELTGHVVDKANILSATARKSLDMELYDYERGTGNQVVVVTLPSLGGVPIEDYGYQLGRHWQLGQKDKNNGALLIVAPSERQVRIEVGYGLEPLLTDAQSSRIIQRVILPAFKRGQMEQGITDGVQFMLAVLGGKGVPASASGADAHDISGWWVLFILLWVIIFAARHPWLAGIVLSQSRIGSSRWGDGGGWGGGGGGSFGGGGASGRW